MIDIQVRLHDRFAVEFKTGYVVRQEGAGNEFMMNTWFFVPHSLDINASTYSKRDFYKDVKSNIRLITPVFSLQEIAGEESVPFAFLEAAFRGLVAGETPARISEYEYQIKMFASIVKSALREEVEHIVHNPVAGDREYLVEGYARRVREIARRYRALRRVVNVSTVPKDAISYYLFGDEYISNLVEFHTFRLLEELRREVPACFEASRGVLMGLIREEVGYKRERGFLVVERGSKEGNRAVIYRRGMLKKYAESELFLRASKRRDGVWVEQVYYSLAAGLSMIFATVISFSFQRSFGNFTMPLFVALVVSYMLKDRIKELARYYFVHRLGRRYFDHKTTIRIKENAIGWIKEGFDFISEGRVPAEVMNMRARPDLLEAENRVAGERIILYRKLVRVDAVALARYNQYDTSGVNDITRFNVADFLEKMDGREYNLYVPGEGDEYGTVVGEKVYYLNFLMQFRYDGRVNYRRFRLMLTRDGIQGIEEL
ncbi:MAG: hypothetical protein LBP56_01255 [Odoribacteraceae bacterium]|jgi:hypothetical protein|nr:hypothetical protein [Odoribacteraceae bacterium]